MRNFMKNSAVKVNLAEEPPPIRNQNVIETRAITSLLAAVGDLRASAIYEGFDVFEDWNGIHWHIIGRALEAVR